MSYRKALDLDELWVGEMRGVDVGGVPVLLVRLDDGVRAYVDRCAHQRVPMSEGWLEGAELVCAAHRWRFDAASGEGTNPRGVALCPLPVRVERGAVLVATCGGAA